MAHIQIVGTDDYRDIYRCCSCGQYLNDVGNFCSNCGEKVSSANHEYVTKKRRKSKKAVCQNLPLTNWYIVLCNNDGSIRWVKKRFVDKNFEKGKLLKRIWEAYRIEVEENQESQKDIPWKLPNLKLVCMTEKQKNEYEDYPLSLNHIYV
jgi:predicted amidophosphoribosyltransferase